MPNTNASSTAATHGSGTGDDDPIEVPDSPTDRRSLHFLLNPAGGSNHFSFNLPSMPDGISLNWGPSNPPPRSERARSRRTMPSASAQPPADVIDLTEEPDSPVEVRQPSIASGLRAASRNPRRTQPNRISPPNLTRSDSTLMGGRHSIIDLTQDTPEERTAPARATLHPNSSSFGSDLHGTSQPPFQPHLHPRHDHRHPRTSTRQWLMPSLPRDEIVEVRTNGGPDRGTRPQRAWAQSARRHLYQAFFPGGQVNVQGVPFPLPNLDVTTNAFAPRPESPQPPMDPVPATREGFTRDTRAETETEDTEEIAVCPACNEELAYDPADTAQKSAAATTSGRKRKRAPGEHHFWALKKCGHVYCADCFENRKPSKNNPGVGFRIPAGKTGTAAHVDTRCAIEDCETKIAQKTEWIGIFL